jgi:hypothetical protein
LESGLVRLKTADPSVPVVAVPISTPGEPAVIVNCPPDSGEQAEGTSVAGSTRLV